MRISKELLQSVLPDKTITLPAGLTITFKNGTEVIKCNRIWCQGGQNAEAIKKKTKLKATVKSKHHTYF